jgi:hypothetical protein
LRSESTEDEEVTDAVEALPAEVLAADVVWLFELPGFELEDGIVATHQMSHMTKIAMIIVTIVFPVFDIYFSYYFNKFMLTE